MSNRQSHPGPNPSSHPPRPLPPQFPVDIGGYQIQRVIGSGGMATVYAAMQKQPRRTVALKVMKAGMMHGPHGSADIAMRRFRREIEILGKLRHPYIAQIYGAGMHDDGSGATPYFVMEYVEGAKTIAEFIAARQLDIRERLKLFVKVCAAVEHGHRRKVIHRDLKPANILIDETGEPKIIDFGVAQATELDLTSQTMHTEAGRLVGTLQYMSPEQLSGKPHDLDARSDVYALGVLLYKLLTGKPPRDLEGLPVYEAVRAIREESPRPPREVNPDTRGDLETIILKAMEPDRARRYRNAGSLGRDIVRFLASKPIHARRAGTLYRAGLFVRRHRVAITSGGIVAVIMSIALAIVIMQRGQNQSPREAAHIAAAPPAETSSESQPASAVASEEAPTSESHANDEPLPSSAPAMLSKSDPPFMLKSHAGSITQFGLTSDGRILASASLDRSVTLWDLSVHPAKRITIPMEAPMQHLSLAADGSMLAAVDDHGPVRLVDVQEAMQAGEGTATAYAVPHTFSAAIRSLAFDSDGLRIAAGLDDLTVEVFPIRSDGSSKPLLMRSTTGAITSVAFGGNQRWIAGGSEGGAVYVWNADDGTLLHRFTDLRARIVVVGFASVWQRIDEHTVQTIPRLVAVAANGSAATWPVEGIDTTSPVLIPAFPGEIGAASLAPGGRWLVCAGKHEARVWNLQRPLEPRQITALPSEEWIYSIAVGPDGEWSALGFAGGDIRLMPF